MEAPRPRYKAALAAVALQALFGYALVTGLNVDIPARIVESIRVFTIAPPPPPPPPIVPRKTAGNKPRGAASPPNLRASAASIVAPPVVVPPLKPPPVIAALDLGTLADPFAGAAPVAGPGTGSGGQGTGTGSGDGGTGDGSGGGREVPLRKLKGNIRGRDYPPGALAANIGGTVYMRFVVGIDGRVGECTITRSSGNAELDETTCRLIRERFRYRPTRDAYGRIVPDIVTGEQEWVTPGPVGEH